MFVDEITLEAKAGRGGDGVVRWRQEKFVDKGGPWGGNGGRGGDVYMRAVRDVGLLARYTGAKAFVAENGEAGSTKSKDGKAGGDIYIEVPIGSTVTWEEKERTFTFTEEGETHKILRGGTGGLGNEHFKSSTNRSPEIGTKGKKGESGRFHVVLALVVDVGIMGFPNAGKSTLLNAITRAHSRVGAYPFTTLEPHLGDFHGFVLADIPGLIEGASEGKGLGHKFLRHIERTRILVHTISLEEEDIGKAYNIIRKELVAHGEGLVLKPEYVVLTKADLVSEEKVREGKAALAHLPNPVSVISAERGDGLGDFTKLLSQVLSA